MDKANFEHAVELKRQELKDHYDAYHDAMTDMYISEKTNVAVIGIQVPHTCYERDMVFIVKENNGKVYETMVFDENFEPGRGRMYPTGISDDGTKFFYFRTTKDDTEGMFFKEEKKI